MMLWNPICIACRKAFEAPTRTGPKPATCPPCGLAAKKSAKVLAKETPRKRRRDKTKVSIGQVVGRLTILEAVYVKNRRLWRCACACGREAVVRQGNLVGKRPTISCGCARPGSKPSVAVESGMRFGRWIVGIAASKRGAKRWECHCDCGASYVVAQSTLISGRSLSCGCLARERAIEINTKFPRSVGGRTCATCAESKPDDQFRTRGNGRMVSYCRDCEKARDASEIANVSLRYARRKLGLPGIDVPIQLIELNQAFTRLKRELKERRNSN